MTGWDKVTCDAGYRRGERRDSRSILTSDTARHPPPPPLPLRYSHVFFSLFCQSREDLINSKLLSFSKVQIKSTKRDYKFLYFSIQKKSYKRPLKSVVYRLLLKSLYQFPGTDTLHLLTPLPPAQSPGSVWCLRPVSE